MCLQERHFAKSGARLFLGFFFFFLSVAFFVVLVVLRPLFVGLGLLVRVSFCVLRIIGFWLRRLVVVIARCQFILCVWFACFLFGLISRIVQRTCVIPFVVFLKPQCGRCLSTTRNHGTPHAVLG